MLHDQRVRNLVSQMLPRVIAVRHQLHQRPELALREVETRATLIEALAETTCVVSPPLLGTDVIADLPGASPRMLALRADMDAIAVNEATGLPYQSAVPGVMHACGHDGHMAMLLGAAWVLNVLREQLPVTVRLIFQPGEEMRGAGYDLVARGACDQVSWAFALHGWPGLPLGMVSSRPDVLMAAGGMFAIVVTGRGCHGAMPELGRNPLPVLARLIERVHRMKSEMFPRSAVVISPCAVHAGEQANVIPETGRLRGTFRYLDPNDGQAIIDALTAICYQESESQQIPIAITFDHAYRLPVRNTALGYRHLRRVVEEENPDRWREAAQHSMAMEDFACYLVDREGAMGWLGLGEDQPALHSPVFDFPDAVLAEGITTLCMLALTSPVTRGDR